MVAPQGKKLGFARSGLTAVPSKPGERFRTYHVRNMRRRAACTAQPDHSRRGPFPHPTLTLRALASKPLRRPRRRLPTCVATPSRSSVPRTGRLQWTRSTSRYRLCAMFLLPGTIRPPVVRGDHPLCSGRHRLRYPRGYVGSMIGLLRPALPRRTVRAVPWAHDGRWLTSPGACPPAETPCKALVDLGTRGLWRNPVLLAAFAAFTLRHRSMALTAHRLSDPTDRARQAPVPAHPLRLRDLAAAGGLIPAEGEVTDGAALLDANPTKLIDLIETGRMRLTQGALTSFSIAADLALVLVAAVLAILHPQLNALNLMHQASPVSASQSAVIANALILAPLALTDTPDGPFTAAVLPRRNAVVRGLAGLATCLAGIRRIDLLLPAVGQGRR